MALMDSLNPSERRLLTILIAEFQIQTLRKLKTEPDSAVIRSLRRELGHAGTAMLKVSYVPPKA